jgi:DNA-binding response OmpR family regulator
MDSQTVSTEPSIVVVEADADLGHVVALALEHHGRPIQLYRSLADAWEAVQTAPALVVLDAGPAAPGGWNALAAVERHRLLGTAPVVLLAWECAVDDSAPLGHGARVCLAKPFDARALDEAVAALLSPAQTALVSSGVGAAATEDASVDAEPAQSPSVWPMVTAAGGFVSVVGFMVHPSYVVGGLAIMLAAILRWALEPAESGARA